MGKQKFPQGGAHEPLGSWEAASWRTTFDCPMGAQSKFNLLLVFFFAIWYTCSFGGQKNRRVQFFIARAK